MFTRPILLSSDIYWQSLSFVLAYLYYYLLFTGAAFKRYFVPGPTERLNQNTGVAQVLHFTITHVLATGKGSEIKPVLFDIWWNRQVLLGIVTFCMKFVLPPFHCYLLIYWRKLVRKRHFGSSSLTMYCGHIFDAGNFKAGIIQEWHTTFKLERCLWTGRPPPSTETTEQVRSDFQRSPRKSITRDSRELITIDPDLLGGVGQEMQYCFNVWRVARARMLKICEKCKHELLVILCSPFLHKKT